MKKDQIHATTTDELPEFISRSDLCKLSGLSDRRHRQLAAAGYFPRPGKHGYKMAPTVAGLLRNAAECMDVDGYPAKMDAAKLRKLRFDGQLSELKLEQLRASLISVAEMEQFMRATVTRWSDINKLKFEVEGPIRLQAKSVTEMRSILKQLNEETRQIWNDGLKDFSPAMG